MQELSFCPKNLVERRRGKKCCNTLALDNEGGKCHSVKREPRKFTGVWTQSRPTTCIHYARNVHTHTHTQRGMCNAKTGLWHCYGTGRKRDTYDSIGGAIYAVFPSCVYTWTVMYATMTYVLALATYVPVCIPRCSSSTRSISTSICHVCRLLHCKPHSLVISRVASELWNTSAKESVVHATALPLLSVPFYFLHFAIPLPYLHALH
jgi:hypothetical protein